MLSKDNFTSYKHQSFFLKLKELARSNSIAPFNFKMIFFGGTGAVGGQAVIEIISSFDYMKDAQNSLPNTTPKLVITGINRSQIDQFCSKLFQIFGKQKFEEIEKNGDESTLLYDQFIELHFKTLMAVPKFHVDLDKALNQFESKEEKVNYLISEASKTTSPFEKL